MKMMKKPNKESCILARHIHDWLHGYATSLRANSPHTIKNYSDALSLFIHFLASTKKIDGSNFSFELLSHNHIEEWILWLKNTRKCSPETCNNRLASIRAFLKYLATRDIGFMYLAQEAALVPRQKSIKKKVCGMSKEAVKALLSVPDVNTRTGKRDLALLVFLYSTATRIDEALSLKVNQLHLDAAKPYVTITGKGNKIRTLYLLPKAVAHISQYLSDFHPAIPTPDSFVFYSRNKGYHSKISQTALTKQLRKYAAIAHEICPEVPLGLHAHQIRHAKSSHWLEDGMNIVQISFLLGHSSVQTTMIYLDITTEQEEKALATLEDENDKKLPKRWKDNMNTLASLCGLSNIN
jgi:site-specific recombinase XerD